MKIHIHIHIQAFIVLLLGMALSVSSLAAAPIITNITSTISDGSYHAGDVIPLHITFDQSVAVTGLPTLTLGSGGTATYSGGSPGATLTFSYTVGTGETAALLDYASTSALALNGGNISLSGGAGTVAMLTLPVPGNAGSLSANKTFVIDTTAPTLASTLTTTTATTLVLTFSETMESMAATALNNYMLSGTGGLRNNPTDATIDSTGTIITLTVPTIAGIADGKNVIVTASGVADLAGNAISPSANVATLVLDSTPAALAFATVSNAPLNTAVDSAAATISGINNPTVITVGTGSSSTLKCATLPSGTATWNAFASCAGMIVNSGDQLKLQLTTPATPTSVSGSINIGNITSTSFTVVPAAAPVVTSVRSTTANGSYRSGDTVSIQVTFDQSVTVTGSPTLALNTGGTATYASGSPGQTLVFTYVVGSGHNTTLLDFAATGSLRGNIALTTIGTPATLVLPTPGATGSLSANNAIVIDTTGPILPAANIVANNTVRPHTIQLTFNEPLASNTETTSIANYTVQNNAGSLTYTLASATKTAPNVILLTLAPVKIADPKTYLTNADIAGHLKVTVSVNITDSSGNAYAGTPITEAGATHNKAVTAPTLTNSFVTPNNTTLVLTFNTTMSTTTATVASNYTLGGTGGLTGTPSAASIDSTGLQVTLTVPTMATFADGKTVAVTASGNITDLAGNALNPSANTATLMLDRTPVAFTFPPISNVAPNAVVSSSAATINGLNIPTPISVGSGSSSTLLCATLASGATEWSKFSACTATTVTNGDQLKLQLTLTTSNVTGTIGIGNISASFTATGSAPVLIPSNISFTPLTSLSAAIGNPDQNLYISSNGVVIVPPSVTTPISLNTLAAEQTTFSIQDGANAAFLLAGISRSIRPSGGSAIAVLRNFSVDGYTGMQTLEISDGRAVIVGSLGTTPIASLQLGTGTTTKQIVLMPAGTVAPIIELKRNVDGSGAIAVLSGKINLRLASAASSITLADTVLPLYANEVAMLTPSGTVSKLRVGSLDGTVGTLGDPLPSTVFPSNVTCLAQVPKLSGVEERVDKSKSLTQSLFDFIGPRSTLAQNTQGNYGTVSLSIDDIPLYLLPIGEVAINPQLSDSGVLTEDGRFKVIRNGVTVLFTPTLFDLPSFSANLATTQNGTITINANGNYEMVTNGRTKIFQPDIFTSPAINDTPGLSTNTDGHLQYVKNGTRQILFPRFYDMAQLAITFKNIDSAMALRDNLDGTVSATIKGAAYTLVPDYDVLSPIGGIPLEHRNDSWWISNGVVYFKYANGSAQGFQLR